MLQELEQAREEIVHTIKHHSEILEKKPIRTALFNALDAIGFAMGEIENEEMEKDIENWKTACRRIAERPPIHIMDPIHSELMDELAADLQEALNIANMSVDDPDTVLIEHIEQALAKKKEIGL